MSFESEYTVGENKTLYGNYKAQRLQEEVYYNSFREGIETDRDKARKIQKEFKEFAINTRTYLVAESINFILSSVLEESEIENADKIGKNLAYNFVKEEGADKLLYAFRTRSNLLSEMAQIINESYDTILEKVDNKNPATFNIKEKDNKTFFSKLKGKDIKDITKQIKKRVAKATEEFVQNNINDKLDIEDSAKQIKDKIDKVKGANEQAEAIKNEYALMHRRNISSIENRKKTVLEQMVKNMTKSILTNNTILESYRSEDGTLLMSKIIDEATVMYSFLETLNTCKFKKVDENYIVEVLSSIK